ncbi:hypothetical protein [Singulisphaera sp. PoT]|uniref:hypothetical protein n=1 Tax=Singulisphaera sp. PoT TaxID=3411797 RepID=UPI003BF61131
MDKPDDGSVHLFLALCCLGCAGMSFLVIIVFGWTLRDGLGPGSVESTGWVALGRFLGSAGILLLIPAAFLAAGIWLYREDLRRQDR